MFYYFGYGSNLSVISLRAKGVDPLSSEPARLEGWKLVFNIPDFFLIEGGTGNIVPGSDTDVVHGALHGCRARDVAKLDQLEAVGVTYRRVETTVTAYSGRRVRAYVYVGLSEILDDLCLPSQRYRNILVQGATDMRLDARYIAELRAMPTCPNPSLPPFARPPTAERVFTLPELACSPDLTALGGIVFDMSKARARHSYLRGLLGGKDATLLFMRRMDTSDGSETIEGITAGNLTDAQRSFVNGYLHEFAREYSVVGRLDYGEHVEPAHFVGAPRVVPKSERSSLASWRPSFIPTSSSAAGLVVPAGEVLSEAEEANDAAGNENLGSLSRTHGFMPRHPPSTALPKEYAAWDELVAELPALYRTLKLRRAVDGLPVLPATADKLPDHALQRAVQVLGMVSHAYHYVETAPPARQPLALAKPWEEVRTRLARPEAAVISYIDLVVNNWRIVDPTVTDPIRVPNLRLLVPTVDNQEERVFYLTQTEILAHASPIVSAVVAAQEATLLHDREALESALVTIIGCLHRMTRESLLMIDPNPFGATHVDPVVWAKTVAPFAVPFERGVQGPSGTSSPIFNVMDIFLGRSGFQTFLGKEIHALRSTYPIHWRRFLDALSQISVSDFVGACGDPRIRGLWKEVSDAYAGKNGFLGRHRMKVYGYLEIAFKVGRSVTIGGFSGLFKDRTWDQVDSELEKSRSERTHDLPQPIFSARVDRVDSRDQSGIVSVVLDVSGTGLRYETRDRCGVLPESDPDLVQRTLDALGVDGDEEVQLTAEWRAALAQRGRYAGIEALPIAELLTLGKIRPLVPRAAEALHASSQNEELKRFMDDGVTDCFELWDILLMLRRDGFDVSGLVREDGGSSLCEIVPPETFRMYSISSVPSSADTESAQHLVLNAGELAFYSARADTGEKVQRRGTASSFLRNAAQRQEPIPIVIDHPPRFGLPRSARVPIVLIAGGTGIAPFLAFLADRCRDAAAAEAFVLLGVRSEKELVFDRELAEALRAGHASVLAALSSEGRVVRYRIAEDGSVGREPFADGPCRIPDLVDRPDVGERLWQLLRVPDEGGLGAHVYVCGRSRFARSAIDAIERVFFRFGEGSDAERGASASERMRRLHAEGRLKAETFSGEAPDAAVRYIDSSEVALHNDESRGYWLAIEQRVYDLSEYIHRHPGGRRVLLGYAGMDATEGYRRVHAGRTEVDATREMHMIGVVRALDLRGRTASVSTPRGNRVVSLAAVHRAWLAALYLIVEMQNALRNDQAVQVAVTTRDEDPSVRSPYRLQRAIETHERFVSSYFDVLARETLPNLWTLTNGFLQDAQLDAEIRAAGTYDPQHLAFVRGAVDSLRASLAEVVASGAPADHPERRRLVHICTLLEGEDERLLVAVKEQLRIGVGLFEKFETATPDQAGREMAAACRDAMRSLGAFLAGVHQQLEEEVELADSQAGAVNVAQIVALRTLHSSPHWTMEEDPTGGLVILRRSAVPFDSISQIISANDEAIACVRDEHARFGIVVDMRQAPSRNDAAFETAMRKLREVTEDRFARLSLLLESPTGILQANRLERKDGGEYLVTTSESGAMKYARGET
jgi:sulfite reductase alpha subunit-like flavoprotein/gamma-glutamylcyclotransferase (GGCT)/AIG2-like uncharacterized protein YtfP